MLPLLPTDALAAEQLKRFVRPIEIGAAPYLFRGHDQDARPIDLNDDCFAGCTIFLLLVESLSEPSAQKIFCALGAAASRYSPDRVMAITVTADPSARANRDMRTKLKVAYPVICDSTGSIAASYGLHKNGRRLAPSPIRLVALSTYRRILAYWDISIMPDSTDAKISGIVEGVMSDAKRADDLAWAAPHAPVLIAPQVFSAAECQRLIDEFDARGRLRIDRPRPGEEPDGYKLPTYEHGRQDRIDHVIRNPELIAFIDARLSERVFPAIRHAFAFSVMRREDLHIARYSGPRGGVEIGHRDNRTATFHRRFALSLNLNDDYEGGGVAFREFSNRAYKNAAGSALVFSSSLLHEVEETTKGVRYTLISHFFDNASVAQAQQAR